MMQLDIKTELVQEPKKVNYAIPPEVVPLIDALRNGLGGKEKWIVVVAGLLQLAQSPENQRNELYAQIKSYRVPGRDFAELIQKYHSSGKRSRGKPSKRGESYGSFPPGKTS